MVALSCANYSVTRSRPRTQQRSSHPDKHSDTTSRRWDCRKKRSRMRQTGTYVSIFLSRLATHFLEFLTFISYVYLYIFKSTGMYICSATLFHLDPTWTTQNTAKHDIEKLDLFWNQQLPCSFFLPPIEHYVGEGAPHPIETFRKNVHVRGRLGPKSGNWFSTYFL